VQQSLLEHKAKKRPLLEIIRGATINLLFVAFWQLQKKQRLQGIKLIIIWVPTYKLLLLLWTKVAD
jgi:hypothetical protein